MPITEQRIQYERRVNHTIRSRTINGVLKKMPGRKQQRRGEIGSRDRPLFECEAESWDATFLAFCGWRVRVFDDTFIYV